MKKNRRPSSENLWLLATHLKRLRQARGYSQVALARRTGLRNTNLSKMERELVNATLANLEALARGLNCSLADLFTKFPCNGSPS